jgi:hypothetical protein
MCVFVSLLNPGTVYPLEALSDEMNVMIHYLRYSLTRYDFGPGGPPMPFNLLPSEMLVQGALLCISTRTCNYYDLKDDGKN